MKFLFINEVFHPDPAATGQHLTDLAIALVSKGHEVTVLTSQRSYENSKNSYSLKEMHLGVHVRRIKSVSFGRSSKWRRVFSAAILNLSFAWNMLWIGDFDKIVAMTSPPLVAWMGSRIAAWKKVPFVYWVMDLNPDEAIEAGWIKKGSVLARILEWILKDTLKHAPKVIVLDHFMKERIENKFKSLKAKMLKGQKVEDENGLNVQKWEQEPSSEPFNFLTFKPFNTEIVVTPPWSHDEDIKPISHDQNPFRKKYQLEKKFVVMYSGNHSICHPLDTLLKVAYELRDHKDIVFIFIGGGERVQDVARFKDSHHLFNILQLPYQERKNLAYSLSAADLHTVVMGAPYVGIVHPCKVYGILKIAKPFLCIGPARSHIEELISAGALGFGFRHGETLKVADKILELKKQSELGDQAITNTSDQISVKYRSDSLIPQMIQTLTSN